MLRPQLPGEGFGLPVAEAMLARVPVIAVAQSGTADFVDDDVATTSRTGWGQRRATSPWRGASGLSPTSLQGDASRLARVVGSLVRAGGRRARAHRRGALLVRRRRAMVRPHRTSPRPGLRPQRRDRDDVELPVRHRRAQPPTDRERGRRVDIRIFADRGDGLRSACRRRRRPSWGSRWEPDLSSWRSSLQSDADVVHVQFNFGFFALPTWLASSPTSVEATARWL